MKNRLQAPRRLTAATALAALVAALVAACAGDVPEAVPSPPSSSPPSSTASSSAGTPPVAEPAPPRPPLPRETRQERLARRFQSVQYLRPSDPLRALEILESIEQKNRNYPGLGEMRQRLARDFDRGPSAAESPLAGRLEVLLFEWWWNRGPDGTLSAWGKLRNVTDAPKNIVVEVTFASPQGDATLAKTFAAPPHDELNWQMTRPAGGSFDTTASLRLTTPEGREILWAPLGERPRLRPSLQTSPRAPENPAGGPAY